MAPPDGSRAAPAGLVAWTLPGGQASILSGGWSRWAARVASGRRTIAERRTKERMMSKREEQKLAALLKKHAGKPQPTKKNLSTQYDSTLRVRPEDQDEATKDLFKEMKRREFSPRPRSAGAFTVPQAPASTSSVSRYGSIRNSW